MNVMKELFNTEVKITNRYKDKVPVAMVYRSRYLLGGDKTDEYKKSLELTLIEQGVDLTSIQIIPMDDGRILGSSMEFDKVYYIGNIQDKVLSYIINKYKGKCVEFLNKSTWKEEN